MPSSPTTEDSVLSPHATEAPYQRFSLARIGAIATNTLVELTRQKVFYTLLVFALVIIATAGFFAQFTFEREDIAAGQIKFVKDFGLGAIAIFGAILAVVGTAQMLPAEIENRTLYTILAKPVRRLEFLLGKYFGVLLLLIISVAIMALLFFVVVKFKEVRVVSETVARSTTEGQPQNVITAEVAKLQKDANDPALVKAIILLFFKMSLLSAITLFFSTFSTSMIFSVVVTTCVYFIGHLEITAKEMLKVDQGGFLSHFFITLVTVLVPNLKAFDVADDIIVGTPVPWLAAHFDPNLPIAQQIGVLGIMLYCLLYIVFLLWFAHLIFSEKEI